LVVNLGGGDVRQQISRLDPIADVDIALFDVAAGTREDSRRLERRRARRQTDGDLAAAVAHQGYANVRNEGPYPLRGRRGIEFTPVVAPTSNSKATYEQQQHACAGQRASVTTSSLPRGVGYRNPAVGFRITPVLNPINIPPHANLGHL
jgi:hypothetical protein